MFVLVAGSAIAQVPGAAPNVSPDASPTVTPTSAPTVAPPTESPMASQQAPPTARPGPSTDAARGGALTSPPGNSAALNRFAVAGSAAVVLFSVALLL